MPQSRVYGTPHGQGFALVRLAVDSTVGMLGLRSRFVNFGEEIRELLKRNVVALREVTDHEFLVTSS